MLNRYSFLKYGTIVIVLVVATIYALPNLYPADPSVQITLSGGQKISADRVLSMQRILEKTGIAVKKTESQKDTVLVRLQRSDQQLKTRELLKNFLGDEYVVALNLAATTPKWLRDIGAHPMNLGLDLSGGVHFLLQVNMEKAVATRLDVYVSEIKAQLRAEHIRYFSSDNPSATEHALGFVDKAALQASLELIRSKFPALIVQLDDSTNKMQLNLHLSNISLKEIEQYALKQNLTTIRNRVNELGVSEPLVQRQGKDRIVVELPGIQDTAQAKNIIGKTANLEFRLEAANDTADINTETFPFRNNKALSARLSRDIIITGDRVANARSGFDNQTGLPEVDISLDSAGGELMNRATRTNIGRKMAVLYVEQKPITGYRMVEKNGKQVRKAYAKFREEKSIISLATIQSALGNNFRIDGLASPQEAANLALLLRSGSLAAPMYFVEERIVGPSLGAQNIVKGVKSALVGFVLVLIFMVLLYKIFGLFANIALALNLVIVLALMSLLGATLTLPGIAGIVLTIGMSVDANVLIFSRIREEIKRGLSIQRAIHEGYDRAFVSIFDANVTTLIVSIILYAIGTGPVRGFAVTLTLGIATSMFTAITGTRALVNLIYGQRNLNKIWI